MNTYQSSKDSGIEWMGNIPESWELTKNRFGFRKHKNGYNESDDTDVLSLTTTGVKVKKDLSFGKSSESYIGHQLVEQGDIVFTPRDFDQTPILSDVSKYAGCISNLYIVDKTKDNLLNLYINYYWYGLKYSVDYFKNFSHGMRYSFNRFQFDEIPLLIPPLQEQQQISDYLDYKTSKIDTLIEKTEQKIELLKEQRTSLINTTVTKGLNPNVEMKDSGVEWIGEIPSGWSVISLRYYLTRVGSGTTPRGGGDVYSDSGIPFLRSQNIHFDGLHLNNVVFISEEIHSNMGNTIVRYGDILLNITGGSIGRSCVVNVHEEMNVNQHVSILRTKNSLINFYLNYCLTSSIGQEQVDYNQTGGNREGLTSENIKNFKFGLPPLQEQQQIVDYLDVETSKIDKLVDMESKRIGLLKEYRQSLISEVVTGKVDVRGEVLV